MIPDKIKLEIITPEKKLYSDDVSSVRVPGSEGYFGVFPGHAPFISSLKIGEIKIEVDKKTSYFATSGGVAEVLPDSVSLLVETCESASAIDAKRAEDSRKRAEKRLQEGRKSWDLDRAHIALARAVNRIKIASQ